MQMTYCIKNVTQGGKANKKAMKVCTWRWCSLWILMLWICLGGGIVLAEIQQNSDLTYRVWDWNRLPKRELHIEKALHVLDFNKVEKEKFLRLPEMNSRGTTLIDTPFFHVERRHLREGEEFRQETRGGFQLLACLKGGLHIETKQDKAILPPFQSLLISAAVDRYTVFAKRDSIFLKLLSP